MVGRTQQSDLVAANASALRSLTRAISLSNGEFSLALVCCNYQVLQERILHQLQENLGKKYLLQKICLPSHARSLYSTIHINKNDLQETELPKIALMVLGLESVNAIDDLLSTINHVRDEFRKKHPFPMVLWVNEEVLRKLRRLAPDFASWAATPIKFEMTTVELRQFLQQETDSLFSTVLNIATAREKEPRIIKDNRCGKNCLAISKKDSSEQYCQCNLEQIWQQKNELHYAIKDLQTRGINLTSELEASLQFVFGLDEYVKDCIEKAINHFRNSFQLTVNSEQLSVNSDQSLIIGYRNTNKTNKIVISTPSPPSPHLIHQGVILFYLGLCFHRLAERDRGEQYDNWQSAKSYFQQCLQVFELAECPALVAQFIGQLCEVLQQLQNWSQLRVVAHKSLELHQLHGSYTQLACDCGYLADVALQESNCKQASKYAQASLFYLAEAKNNHQAHQALFPLLLEQIYQLVLVKALQLLGEEKTAQQHLDNASKKLSIALENSDYRYDAHRYIRLLRRLRWLYYESGKYLEAFFIRRERRSVEQQYGLRAFIGAGRLQPQRQAKNPVLISPAKNTHVALEITASGRERDINLLIGKISRSDKKLILIHGESGVGKSSIVNAGLVPALQNRPIGDQIAVPVVLQVYTDWVRELGKSLSEAMFVDTPIQYYGKELSAFPYPTTPITVASILEQLQENANNHLITVLIFDQLEEFFFACNERSQKEEFDNFICECLNIAFVKIVFSLREDYLHHLLDLKRLAIQDSISNNILDKDIRYQVNNLSAEDAKRVIQKLTERSEYNIEPALIESLVEDLSSEIGEVRPIELQVVGAQLQDERITTLAKYEPYRPNKLIERYIKEIIKDCGWENEQAALLVLYLLTDENHKRPFKTKAELIAELAEFDSGENLELVLEILVRSGLVVLFADVTERYQLIHDYLVYLIRSFQQEELIQTQLTQLRNQVQQREAEITRLHSELRKKKQSTTVDTQPHESVDLFTELKELRKREELSRRSIEKLSAELEQQKLQTQLTESLQQQKLSEVRVNRSLKIALAGSITAIFALTVSTIMSVYLWRQSLISEIRAISASAEELASYGKDFDALRQGLKAAEKFKTAFLPDAYTKAQVMTALHQVVPQIRETYSISGHLSGVNSVAFSPLNSLMASGSADNTVKLWYPNGKFFRTLSGHTDVVNSVTFSPDGTTVASASQDKTVKLWTVDGRVNIRNITLSGHENVVNSVAFSRDGRIIASGSSDKTVKLWNRQGKSIKTLFGHDDAVLQIAFSPGGEILASASSDKTIKLWDKNGNNIRTFSGHRDAITSIAWSNDGKIIASASLDNTVKLWNLQGKLLKVIKAHSKPVTAVNFSPDNQIIATVSTDETVKLWRWKDGILLGTLKGHKDWVNDVIFSPDNKILASASRDKTVKLWSWQDLLLGNLKTHNKAVTSVSFSPNGNLIASGSTDKTIKLWNRNGSQIKTLQPQEEIWDVSFSPVSVATPKEFDKIFASAGKDKTIKLWQNNGKLIKKIAAHNNVILSLAWSKDGNILASASKDKTVKLWRRNGELITTLTGHKEAVNWVSFSHDGNIASASDDNTVKIWHKSGKLLHTLTGHKRPVFSVSWSNKDNMLASASLDGTVKLWNSYGELQQTLIAEGEEFTGVTFSPDGKLLAATSEDKVKLWQRDGTLLITLKADREEFTSIGFSPDGEILSGTDRGTIILRDLDNLTLEKLLNKGCDALQDYGRGTDGLCTN